MDEQNIETSNTAKTVVASATDGAKLHADIRTACCRYDLGHMADALIATCPTIEEARSKILDAIAERQSKHDGVAFWFNPDANKEPYYNHRTNQIVYIDDQRNKHLGAVHSALIERALGAGRPTDIVDKVYPQAERSPYADAFRYASLLDLARECLHADGIDTRGLSKEQTANAALGFGPAGHLRSGAQITFLQNRGAGYHTSGHFSNLLLDASNKSLQVAYAEFPATWPILFRVTADVPDFKNINSIKLGDVENLHGWQDSKEPDHVSFSEEKLTYAIEAYSAQVSFTWKTLVNDDLDGLSRTPQILGAAAARTVNAFAWKQITDNPVMGDGQRLFLATLAGNRKSGVNLLTGSATPTVSTMDSLTKLVRLQKGLNTRSGNAGNSTLGLVPRFLVVPAALATTAEQLVYSTADPASSGNSGKYNPARAYTVVVEPLLDATSSTAFYLFTDYRNTPLDVVKLTFLEGHQTPQQRTWTDPATMALHYAVLQCFAATADDHRGAARHDGV